MGMFLSTFVNRIDSKGRISVPPSFRTNLQVQDGSRMIVFPSLQNTALDACSLEHMEQLSESLESPELPPEQRELIETVIFGASVELTLDSEGRIILPQSLLAFAGITREAAFVGRRRTFQIWDPAALTAHESALRERAKDSNISLSTIIARGPVTRASSSKTPSTGGA